MNGAHEVQGVGTIGVERERLLATGQRLEKPAIERVLQDLCMQQRQRLRARGGLALGPGLLRIHEGVPEAELTSAIPVVMAGLVPPAGPKPLRRGEGPAIHVFATSERKTWMPGSADKFTQSAQA